MLNRLLFLGSQLTHGDQRSSSPPYSDQVGENIVIIVNIICVSQAPGRSPTSPAPVGPGSSASPFPSSRPGTPGGRRSVTSSLSTTTLQEIIFLTNLGYSYFEKKERTLD